MFSIWSDMFYEQMESAMQPADTAFPIDRHEAVVSVAEDAGLFQGASSQVGVRLPERLLATAKANSGIESTSDLVRYALARIAIEDDFGTRLLARKGSIPPDLDLEF
jgi:hypothetical protein